MTELVGTPLDCAVLRPRPVDLTYDPVQETTQAIWHTAVSGAHDPGPPFPAPGTPNYGVDWTGYLDEGDDHDAPLYLYRGIDINCDATDDANVRAIAFETWDGADPELNKWTPGQIHKMKVAMTELHEKLGIPYVQCPAWDAPGFGYHRLFPEWDKPFHYHSCPGNLRAQQWADEIVPWLAVMAAGPSQPAPTPLPPEDDMNVTKAVYVIIDSYATFGNADTAGKRAAIVKVLQAKDDAGRDHAVAETLVALAGL